MISGYWDHRVPEFFKRKVQAKWNAWLRDKYKSEALLLLRWGELEPGELLDQGTIGFPQGNFWKSESDISRQRYADLVEFLLQNWEQHTDEMIRTVRAQAPKGVGCNVAPVIAACDAGGRVMPVAYASRQGDVVAANDYHGLLTTDKRDPRYPWVSRLTHPPTLQSGLWFAESGKPYITYEGGVYRPNPYRAEYPLQLGLVGCWQDYDAFFPNGHFMGRGRATNEECAVAPLVYAGHGPGKEIFDGGALTTDEVQLAQWRTAGAIFRHGYISPAPNPTVVTFGRKAVLGRDFYYFQRALQGSSHVHPTLEWTQVVYGGRVAYDYGWDGEFRVEGQVAERPTGPVRWGDQVVWNWQNGQVVADTPHCKVVAGFVGGEHEFQDGVKVEGFNRPFVCFTLVSEDGLPLSTSKQAIASAVSTSDNTGLKIDPSKMVFTPHRDLGPILNVPKSLMAIVTDPGRAPVDVKRVSCKVTLPHLTGRRCKKIDFALRTLSDTPAEEGFSISADEPVFTCELIAP